MDLPDICRKRGCYIHCDDYGRRSPREVACSECPYGPRSSTDEHRDPNSVDAGSSPAVVANLLAAAR